MKEYKVKTKCSKRTEGYLTTTIKAKSKEEALRKAESLIYVTDFNDGFVADDSFSEFYNISAEITIE